MKRVSGSRIESIIGTGLVFGPEHDCTAYVKLFRMLTKIHRRLNETSGPHEPKDVIASAERILRRLDRWAVSMYTEDAQRPIVEPIRSVATEVVRKLQPSSDAVDAEAEHAALLGAAQYALRAVEHDSPWQRRLPASP
jgi:hypothetical protein